MQSIPTIFQPSQNSPPAYITLRIPMPIPGTTDAPLFNGDSVSGFVDILLQHGANAGITDLNDLVPYILRYSSDSVKAVIRFMPEFDRDVPNKTWSDATAALFMLYGSSDTINSLGSEDDLKEFCRASSAGVAFASKRDVDAYHRGFQRLSAPLVKHELLSPTQRDYYFITGIPAALRGWFFLQVPESKQRRSNPPSVAESVSYLHQRFDIDSLYFNPLSARSQYSHSRVPCPHSPDSQQQILAISPIQIEEPAHEVEEVAVRLGQDREGRTQESPQHRHVRDYTTGFHRCFICGKSGDELKHPFHPSRCTETPALLSEGLIVFNRSTRRYTLPNGDELPTVRGYSDGLATYLRLTAEARSDLVNGFPSSLQSLESVQKNVLSSSKIDSVHRSYPVPCVIEASEVVDSPAPSFKVEQYPLTVPSTPGVRVTNTWTDYSMS